MKKRLVGVLLASALLGAGAAPAVAAPAVTASASGSESGSGAKSKPVVVDFAGTVALSNCSGSVVRMPHSQPDDPALVMSNGHCLETGFPGAGEVIVDRPSTRTFTLLDAEGDAAGTLKASKIAYATMTDTDVSLYELTSTYAQIHSQYGIKALELNATHPVKNRSVKVVSGYWKKIYSCGVDGFAYRLKEGVWTWKDSVRYTSSDACQTIGGTSGSPVIDTRTGKVVAVNNTSNEDGERCTLNNPCEVDRRGNVTVRHGARYAQQTYGIVRCVAHDSKIDLDRKGCKLPKP
ncbi:trypsin-like peptidase domain-containing protein [Streptomyces flavidovirens]|uniref:Trypsin-like peptidase domain-containing protein n=1 Tax=Streptomyces flavidovirens TaxID=67298 RepID=A0ABW6RK11_9ACTN